MGMNELLLSSDLDERQRKHGEMARRAAEGLLGMVDDLLDYAQLEGGKLSSDQFVFDLAELVQAAVDSQRAVAESKGLEVVTRIEESARIRLLSDPRRVRQILRHLIGNAIKFTDHGSVRVLAAVRPQESGPRLAILEISDTGIGIAAERRGEIFESFSQVDPSSTRRHGGTGIGLALSKALAERLGGRLEFEPAGPPGPGSVFRLVFPIREHQPMPPGAPAG
ncbi:MAG: ATP-binding protein [Thermoanaerobaculia bacterium]